MKEISARKPTLDVRAGTRNNTTPAIGEIEYELESVPAPYFIPNASKPTVGRRKLKERLEDDPAAVLQFYREAEITDGNKQLRIRNQTKGQPPFNITPIGLVEPGGAPLEDNVPKGWRITKYRLIWRLLELDIEAPARELLRMDSLESLV